MKKIAIIGAGNIGRRYLQSFALAKEVYEIYVVDVNNESLVQAQEVTKDFKPKHKIQYSNNLNCLPENLDLAAITTTSSVRAEIIVDLLNVTKVKYLILEKYLFNKLCDYDLVDDLLKKNNIKAWVNCTRRVQKSYIKLKENMMNARNCTISISGGNWGLACNVIHMLDMIAYLAGSDNAQLSLDGLEDEIYDSKRPSFKEIFGTISGYMGKCKNFSISCYHSTLPVLITITTEHAHYQINEKDQCMNMISADGEYSRAEFPSLYTSQMMETIIYEIIETGNCKLATYSESLNLHKLLQIPLTRFFEDHGFDHGVCPIT